MIKFFRKIRQNLLVEGKTGPYIKYAVGEIFLVVIGILIALQVNDWNERNKLRTKELIYLENIKADLELNVASLHEFIEVRQSSIHSVEMLLEYFNEKESLNLKDFNAHSINVMVWYPFVQHSNTFQELMNSGNLASILNKDIKTGLQNMQTAYEKITFVENEMQQDFETYLYEPYFSTADLEENFNIFNCLNAQQQGTVCGELNLAEFQELLRNKKFKNGFMLASFNSNILVEEYSRMINNTEELIAVIEKELSL